MQAEERLARFLKEKAPSGHLAAFGRVALPLKANAVLKTNTELLMRVTLSASGFAGLDNSLAPDAPSLKAMVRPSAFACRHAAQALITGGYLNPVAIDSVFKLLPEHIGTFSDFYGRRIVAINQQAAEIRRAQAAIYRQRDELAERRDVSGLLDLYSQSVADICGPQAVAQALPGTLSLPRIRAERMLQRMLFSGPFDAANFEKIGRPNGVKELEENLLLTVLNSDASYKAMEALAHLAHGIRDAIAPPVLLPAPAKPAQPHLVFSQSQPVPRAPGRNGRFPVLVSQPRTPS
jgi:hypothetical protein